MWLPRLQCGVSKKTSERYLEWIASGLQSGFVREKQKSGLDFSRNLLIVGLDFFSFWNEHVQMQTVLHFYTVADMHSSV